jgi:hypothetical protein
MTFRGDHIDELISASLTGDLTAAERAEMDAHLARCEKCRATLATFKTERRILAALPPADPPRDLSARVRAGIDSGRLGAPWWQRPGSRLPLLASAAVFSAVILAVVVLGKLPTGPVGLASGSPQATLASAPAGSLVESNGPSAGPSAPPRFLAPGEMGYLELTGASLQPLKLSFINDATGALIDVGTVGGPPIAASLSPDGQWLAYITQKGETGAHEVWALHLTDGTVTPLGCSLDAPFADRLAWQPDSSVLAYTLVAVDLGPASGCPANDFPPGSADAWEYEVAGERGQISGSAGSAFGASFTPRATVGDDGLLRLLVSHPAPTPWTESLLLNSDAAPIRLDDVFLPLGSPDGNRALYWSGKMAQANGVWQFSRGGMPQLSRDFRSAGPASPWVGTPLFSDLTPVGGEAFASGKFTWGPDSDQFAFWDGAWTGAPQSADGTYPSQKDLYTGRIVGGSLLSKASRAGINLPDGAWIVDVALAGTEMAITIGLPSAGIGDPPSAYVQIFRDEGGVPRIIGGGVNPPAWDGPAVYGR